MTNIVITEENYTVFKSCIPPALEEAIIQRSVFALGFIDDLYDNDLIGVIIFRESGRWLKIVSAVFTDEFMFSDYPFTILDRLIRDLKNDGYYTGIYSDLSLEEESHLRSLYYSLSFDFSKHDSNTYSCKIADLADNKLLHSGFSESNIIFLEKASNSLKNELIHKIDEDDRDLPFPNHIKWENYDMKASCIYLVENEPKGLLLVQSSEEHAAISCTWSSTPTAPITMLAAAISSFENREKADITLIIPVLNEQAESLVKKVIPEAVNEKYIRVKYRLNTAAPFVIEI